METSASAADLTNRDDTLQRGRIFSDLTIAQLARIPDHKLNLHQLYRDFGISKSDLLWAHASGEIAHATEPTGALIGWIELTFPEDLRIAIIRYGQDRLYHAIKDLNSNISSLITELQIVTKHKTK